MTGDGYWMKVLRVPLVRPPPAAKLSVQVVKTDADGFTVQVYYNRVCLSLPPRANLIVWMPWQRDVTKMSISDELRMRTRCISFFFSTELANQDEFALIHGSPYIYKTVKPPLIILFLSAICKPISN